MKKILVIQQKMIGDVLVCSILCNNLKKAYPEAEIHYMVYESTIPVLQENPNIDKLILFTEEYRKSKWAFFKFMMRIRKEKYDVLIDSYSKLESWLTSFFSGAKRRISYKKKGRKFLYTDVINMYDKPLTNLGLIIERRLSLLEPLNLNISLDPIPKLYVNDAEKQLAKQLMAEHGIDSSKKSIMISILGSSDIKTLPLKYMSKVIDFIVEKTDANILFNYIPNQFNEAKEIYDGCNNATKKAIFFNLLGNSLRGYIALMNECDMIIGNDGGAINMAKALNKPSFIIFSPWIEKQMWATFEDGKFHKSVHLKDYRPELFVGKSEKDLKRNSIELYQHFKPKYIYNDLKSFLDFNLKEQNVLDLKSLIKSKSNKDRKKFSAIVITKNEGKNLPSLIRNLNFADEIIIVDSFSTDGTVEIIKNHPNVKFVQKEFVNYSDQRNFAIEQSLADWVLFVDADERLPKSLQREILDVLSLENNTIAYEMYRQFYFDNEILKYSGFQTDKVFRLFHKRFANYDEKKFVHETLVINGQTQVLKNKLAHYSFTDYDEYKSKMENYAKLRAKELFIKKLNPNFYHFVIKPLYRFIYHYIVRWGFLDGKKGYIIASLNAYGVKQRYIELKKIRKAKIL